ncbi:hypothetical protein SCOR_00875 [Sulfidibacter corallicola]|uniref:Uncharacterized protein n=1 Tax=Sulfidibacter corallicola TaxID=2818388 RepID=A0A8A4TJ91_SULCO|nr:hypothetical protein [Sulfidibacter corallicola]QTD48921.1 hypothetical protein J3U87_25335 [Sulfidibacter corallicola]
MSSSSKVSRPWGQISAGLVGGLLLALAVGVTFSIYWPSEPFDRMFLGALLFPLIWIAAMLYAFTADSGKRAWLTIGILSLVFTAFDALGLYLHQAA